MTRRRAAGIELRHLRYFSMVARELHFGRAAQRLNISQPPLSVQIRRLEQMLGLRLFDRDTTRVSLTPAGEHLRDEVDELFSRIEEMFARVRDRAQGLAGALRIGFVTPAAYGLMPECLAAYRAAYPGVELILREMTTDAQLEALSRGALDLGFVLPPAEGAGLAYAAVAREPLLVALPASDPAAGVSSPVALRSLRDRALVIFPRQHAPGLYDDVIALCRRAGYTPIIGQQAIEMQTIVSLVAAGMGIAIVPASVRNLGRQGVRYRALKERSPLVELGLAWMLARDNRLLEHFRATVARVAKRRGR